MIIIRDSTIVVALSLLQSSSTNTFTHTHTLIQSYIWVDDDDSDEDTSEGYRENTNNKIDEQFKYSSNGVVGGWFITPDY